MAVDSSVHMRTSKEEIEMRSRSTDEAAKENTAPVDRSVARAALRGAKGGLIATVVMTIYRLPIFRSLPPTAEFWAQYVGGGEPEDYPAQALALHLLYGAGGGAAFGPLFARLARQFPERRGRIGVVAGALYGVALSAFGSRIILDRLLGLDVDSEEALVFHVGHLVYGLTLGTWLGSRRPLGEVYDRSRRTR